MLGPFVKLPRDLSLVGLIDRLNRERQNQFAQSTGTSTVSPTIGTTITSSLWFDPDDTFDVGLFVDGSGVSDLRPSYGNFASGLRVGANATMIATGSAFAMAGLGVFTLSASTGSLSAAGGWTVIGATTFNQSATFLQNISVLGDTALGNASVDRITGTALVNRDWDPVDTGGRLGGSSNRWTRLALSTGATVWRTPAALGTNAGYSLNNSASGSQRWDILPVTAEVGDTGYDLVIQRTDSGGTFPWLTVLRDTGAWTTVGDHTQTGTMNVSGATILQSSSLTINGLAYTFPGSQATNRVLRNTGPGTLAWSQVDLSTDVTGALATGTVPAAQVTAGTFGAGAYTFPGDVNLGASLLNIGTVWAGFTLSGTTGLHIYDSTRGFNLSNTAFQYIRVAAAGQWAVARVNGDTTTPTVLNAGETIGEYIWQGWSGAGFTIASSIRSVAVETFGTGPTRRAASIIMRPQPKLGGTVVGTWTFDSEGHLLAGDAVAGTGDNTFDFGMAGAQRARTGYFGTSIVIGTDPGGSNALRVGGASFLAGHATFATDNLYDVGASGATRPRAAFHGSASVMGRTLTSALTLANGDCLQSVNYYTIGAGGVLTLSGDSVLKVA